MKREILFKGKLSHSNGWIEGNLIITHNGNPCIIPSDVFSLDGHHLLIDSDNPFRVDENTICQYIGYKDKNQIRIFEGDFDSDGNCVVWCDNCSGWEFSAIDVPTKDICIPCHRCDGNFFFEEHIDEFEVIANIND